MDDEALVARYLELRDESLFRELVERYQERVLRLVSSVLGPHGGDAEEAAQDAFLRAHEKLGQFRGEARFGTWLYRVAYGVAVNRARLARLRRPHVGVAALRDAASDDDPHGELATRQRDRVVHAAVASLPDLYRTIVLLHYWHEQPLGEVAELLGMPAGTIKSYLHRARQQLARVLGEQS